MKNRWPQILLLFCAGAFAYGLFELVRLRYEGGDVFPAYSSLRCDPLGTRIFYESLEKAAPFSVRRDFAAHNRLPDERNTTYLHLAALRTDWGSIPADLMHEIDRFVARGGRLAVSFLPETAPVTVFVPPRATGAPARKRPASPEAGPARIRVGDHWGVELGFDPLGKGAGGVYQAVMVENQTDLLLPRQLAWHSGMVFTNLAPGWQTIYARGTNAVVIQRQFGAGSVVMASDSFFLSNEALSGEPQAELLAWFVGPAEHAVFDEAHLGITETQGVATLLRKYRLHGVAAGLLVLAALFIWKNSASLLPPHPEEEGSHEVAGKDVAAGFVNLLRRNVAPRDLLATCFDEWTKSLGEGPGHSLARVDQAQAVIEAENTRARTGRNPVRAYQQICRALKPAKGKGQ